ncbi:MAG TPA: DNA repair protein RecO [Kiritimatiellia bacterium]|nr:DNA repair protein RecO [Kiritimatiellia bacterium]HNR93411.1 DNA repair protein RecO [Kiritimatiellia bacterium]HNS80791.1 DNA repair protein RecO [Kiritimatiellia bacterium]HPA77118.1 DNA repair protein RecO [Kiritimatiellia bacterium]HQQ03289.1 DNA repair protein RecO [Kiritimatiellia bacterium]
MSRILKTDAIALRIAPVSNTSSVVTWLTPGWGRLSTMIKGGRRPKSRFLGQYDLFYTCELLFYGREHRELHIASECCPLKMRPALRTDWRAAAMASYFADLAARIGPVHAEHADTWRLLDEALDDLAARGAAAEHTFWLEMKLLESMGLAPRLQDCLHCGRELEPGRDDTWFSHERGGLICRTCAGTCPEEPARLAPDIFAALRGLQRARHSSGARAVRCQPRQAREIEGLLGRFLSWHFEIPLTGRDIAFRILRASL